MEAAVLEGAAVFTTNVASAVSTSWPIILVRWLTSRPFCYAMHDVTLTGGAIGGELGQDPWQNIRRVSLLVFIPSRHMDDVFCQAFLHAGCRVGCEGGH